MSTGTLVNGETLNGTFTLSKQNGTTITLNTQDKFIAKNVSLTFNSQSASPAFDGGALNNTGASAVFTNMTTSTTDTSGIAIATKGTAGRDAVLYNGLVNGWVSVADNTIASNAVSSTTWDGTTYYATGVTIGAGKSFSVTVPNGENDSVTFTFMVDANGNTTIE